MPKVETEAVLDAPESEITERRKGKSPKNRPPRRRPVIEDEPEGGPTFWQKVAAVAKADWGPRANVYVYRVEPRIDRSRSGNTNYITKYAEPISEDRILADHGSGKYKLMLNFRKPGADQGDEVDSIYVDILNMQFPPKVPPGEWVDDPANKRWAWAKQSFPREGGERPAETIRETLELADAIRGAQQPPDPVKTTLETIRAVQQLNQQPQRSATDELQTLVTVAEKLRPAETVPAFMQAQFTALQGQITASQERADKLLMILLEDRRKGHQDGGVNVIKEVVGGLKELVPTVKDLFPNLGEGLTAGAGSHSRMNGWQEFIVQMGPTLAPVLAPFASVFATAMGARFMGGGPAPVPHGPAQPGQPHQPHPQPGQAPQLPGPTMMPFLQMIATPLMNYARTLQNPEVNPEELGHDFASWVFDGYGTHPEYANAIMAAKTMGAAGILGAFQQTPLWSDKGPNGMMPSLAELQPKLPAFFTAFLNYDPNADVPDDEQEDEPEGPPQVVTYRGDGAPEGANG